MNFTEYTQLVLRTESPANDAVEERMLRHTRALHALMGLQTEIGELVDVWKREIFYNKSSDGVNIIEEIGDIAWYLALLCDHIDVEFEQCLQINIAKLQKRYPEKFDEGKAINRDLEAEREALQQPESFCSTFEAVEAVVRELPSKYQFKANDTSPKKRRYCGVCGGNTQPSTMHSNSFTCKNCGSITTIVEVKP
jgi:NTP pyrophosphatase (non-canonical NTP hydrolase)